ncbi:MAG: gamma-glutamylcyclotransferase [Rhodospirillaceae bacterium]|jgi:hypothetical protein|nr:gamma-glutamylcyclotransferase [Rhodospirillaceae bacterium]MBT5049297.1 gamma-glutamylcyclotransferase [Rhodospirillaceae bacterium]MBT5455577.1 gamma-glutamylcyclotransferase [Rhodospirillaceae bacterium]
MWRGARRTLRRACVTSAIHVWPLARAWYRHKGLKLDGRPDELVWYFAFGANMHHSAFIERRRMRPVESRAGRLSGYRLRFNLEGRPKGRAAPANISPDESAEVWGVLYCISRRDLVRLNASEGIPGPRYRPHELAMQDANGKEIIATAYIADGLPQDGKPSLRYLTLLREGARSHGLPEHWICFLDGVTPAE